MKFNILGLEENYGKHRFSNNEILNRLQSLIEPSNDLNFIWWVEKIFIDPKYSEIVEELYHKPWFGVVHVPLLTPNWSMYSQNNLSKLYLSESWKKAKKNCVGIICLSEHLAEQFKAFSPDLNVYNLKHPVGEHNVSFNFNSFKQSPKMVLVGAWLRNYAEFCQLDSSFDKYILHNSYSRQLVKERYARYCPTIHSLIKPIKTLDFLSNEEYDKLIASSLVFLGLHETSANNAVCECISYSTPFVSLKHPAVVEYVGIDYPLLFDNYAEISEVGIQKVKDGYEYLKDSSKLKDVLSYASFLDNFQTIYQSLVK